MAKKMWWLLIVMTMGRVLDFEADGGAVPGRTDLDTSRHNTEMLNRLLVSLEPHDHLVFQDSLYSLMGGVVGANLVNVTFHIEGTLQFSTDTKHWPRDAHGNVLGCMNFTNFTDVVFTSTTEGTLDGNGKTWWGIPLIGYLLRGENRPKLFDIGASRGILVEKLFFKNSPYWTFWAHEMDGLEVRDCRVIARRDDKRSHHIYDLSAFNTDGFDVSGRNVWIHDCRIDNQDDCISVKDDSQNMLFERIHATGIGLTIGSIRASVVRNITFRDCVMEQTYKGIYLKFREGTKPGVIEDVLYQNITIDRPEQFAIWIGPAQQSDSNNLCAAHPCSLCWPTLPFTKCNPSPAGLYRNITLRDIRITNPKKSPGLLLAAASNPMQHVVFDNVVVVGPSTKPFGHAFYKCEHVDGVATGNTFPVPPCFRDLTGKVQ